MLPKKRTASSHTLSIAAEWWPYSVPKVTRSRPTDYAFDLWPACPCNWWSGGITLWRMGGNSQSIGPTVSDAIVRSWLCATTTGSCPLGYFSSIAASTLLIIGPTNCSCRFSTRELLVIEDFTFTFTMSNSQLQSTSAKPVTDNSVCDGRSNWLAVTPYAFIVQHILSCCTDAWGMRK